MPRYVDAHTHVHFPVYDTDRPGVLARARAGGVAMVMVGTTRGTSEAAVALAAASAGVYTTVGIHPSHACLPVGTATSSFWDVEELGSSDEAKRLAREGEQFDAVAFRALAAHPKVVAIGECGLDYHRLPEESAVIKEAQRELFVAQVALAFEVGKPLMIHCREAMPDLISLLVTNESLLNHDNPGVMHFFTGTALEARVLADLGFSFTFGGVVTFARDYDEVIRSLPADRILAETDAPYVAPVPYRGKRNEPAYVVEVYQKLAGIRVVDAELLRDQINRNAERVFGIKITE